MSANLEALVRSRIEEALTAGRDPTAAAMAAVNEHNSNLTPNASVILRQVRRLEIHRGPENRYCILLQAGEDEETIELTQKELAKNADAFNERYLQHFNRIPRWAKGEWPGFVEALLHSENVIIMEGREEVNIDVLAVEEFIERAQRWKPTRDIHQSVRDEDKVWWDDDTDTILLRSERVNQFLKSKGYASEIPIDRFAFLLKERGVVMRTSFQHKIPAPASGGKAQNLRFWRLDPRALGFTRDDILAPVSAELPPEPIPGAEEGTG